MSLAAYLVVGGGFIESVCTARGRFSEPAPTGLWKIIHVAKNGWFYARILAVRCAIKNLHN